MTAPGSAVAPTLVFGWGNVSRGDDALGPLCVQGLRAWSNHHADVEYFDDYQLQIEHALDLLGRRRVLFVDASLSCHAPFEVAQIAACRDASISTHAVSPQCLMQVFHDLRGEPGPPCTLLQIRGGRFELGEPPSPAALRHLKLALRWAQNWLLT